MVGLAGWSATGGSAGTGVATDTDVPTSAPPARPLWASGGGPGCPGLLEVSLFM